LIEWFCKQSLSRGFLLIFFLKILVFCGKVENITQYFLEEALPALDCGQTNEDCRRPPQKLDPPAFNLSTS
jgi:hypothetical protein